MKISHPNQNVKAKKDKEGKGEVISQMILTRIMTLKSTKEILDYFERRIWRKQEDLRYKSSKFDKGFWAIIKKYSNNLLDIANNIKLLSKEFFDSKPVEKMSVTMFGRYETFIKKRFVYNYFDRSNTCLASTWITKTNERISYD